MMGNFFSRLKLPKTIIWIFAGLVVVLSSFFLGRITSSTTSVTSVQPVKRQLTLNKEFEFGPAASKFKYILDSAELRDEIVIKGQKAYATEGRDFLVLNIKLKNDKDKPIELLTRDFIRLTINNNDTDRVAPEIHNDPVVVQPISTKETRVGFPIYESDKNLKLLVGEINGEKNTIDLIF